MDYNATGVNTLTFDTPSFSVETSSPSVTSIVRPAFNPASGAPTPAIPDSERYVLGSTRDDFPVISGDTFVNGSLHINGYLNLKGSLFVNGILTFNGGCQTSQGDIIVAGYNGDVGSPDYGISIDIADVGPHGLSTLYNDGTPFSIFAEGDVRVKNSCLCPDIPDMDTWIQAMPATPEKLISTFQSLGLRESSYTDASDWFTAGTGPASFLKIPGKSGYDILRGTANSELTDMGYKPVPEEVSEWFNHPDAYNGFLTWAAQTEERWDTFKLNPTLYQSHRDEFLPAVIYTHGNVITEGTTYPARILGGAVTLQNDLYSPDPDGPGPLPSHGGNIILSGGASVIYCPDCFKKSGKSIIKPILTIYSWVEL